MISVNELAEAARYMDAMAEEHGFTEWTKLSGIDADALQYVANQRALRVAMMMDGQDPSKLSRTVKTTVSLSPRIQKLMPHLTVLAMDGIGIGLDVGRKSARQES